MFRKTIKWNVIQSFRRNLSSIVCHKNKTIKNKLHFPLFLWIQHIYKNLIKLKRKSKANSEVIIIITDIYHN